MLLLTLQRYAITVPMKQRFPIAVTLLHEPTLSSSVPRNIYEKKKKESVPAALRATLLIADNGVANKARASEIFSSAQTVPEALRETVLLV